MFDGAFCRRQQARHNGHAGALVLRRLIHRRPARFLPVEQHIVPVTEPADRHLSMFGTERTIFDGIGGQLMQGQAEHRHDIGIQTNAIAMIADLLAPAIIGTEHRLGHLPDIGAAGFCLVQRALIGAAQRLNARGYPIGHRRLLPFPPGHVDDGRNDGKHVLDAMAQLPRHHPRMLLIRARGVDVGHVPLAAEQIFQLVLVIVDRADVQGIPEGRAVLLVIEDFHHGDRAGFHRIAQLVHRLPVGIHALQKTAIMAENFLLVITGQLPEGAIAEDDRIVLLIRIGQTDRHAGLRHGLFEQKPGSAGKPALILHAAEPPWRIVERRVRLIIFVGHAAELAEKSRCTSPQNGRHDPAGHAPSNCNLARRAYRPPPASSSSWLPCSTIRP